MKPSLAKSVEQCYYDFAALPPPSNGKEVKRMAELLDFLLAVAANVLSCYICKWLDGWRKGR